MKESNGYSKHCRVKNINNNTVYLYKSFDLMHGLGYFAHAYSDDLKYIGFGFSKSSKIAAVKQCLKR